MTCDEGRIAAFLHGELSDEDEQGFDEHLLTCESCWWAVREDRVGRDAVERLRVPAPLGLADRVAISIDLAGRQPAASDTVERRRGRAGYHAGRLGARSPRRLAAAAAIVVVVAGGTLGWVLHQRPPGDPPQITQVVAMMAPNVAASTALRDGEHFDFGGQSLTVRSYDVDGVVTLVATSARPFPMPSSSHLLAGSSSTAWMATHGRLAMYGVNHPVGSGRPSVFLIAATPMEQLPQIASQLHVI